MKLSTEQEIRALHKKLASHPKVFKDIFTHCQIVKEIAYELIKNKKLAINQDLVGVGALLHDIGCYTFYDDNGNEVETDYITHGVRGYQLLKSEGFDEEICQFASHHTGVGISAEDVRVLNLSLPAQDYFAENTEQRLVMYADKFHSKGEKLCFNSPEWYKKHVARFGEHKVKIFEEMIDEFGLPDIANLSNRYSQEIR